MIKNKKKFLTLILQTLGFILLFLKSNIIAQTQTEEINPIIYDINILIFVVIVIII